MSNLFDISGKNIVITGAGGVLCGEMARACAKARCKVSVLSGVYLLYKSIIPKLMQIFGG